MFEIGIFVTLIIVSVAFCISLIFFSHRWNRFQIWTLKKEKQWFGQIPFYKDLIKWEMNFCKSKYGLWFFRSVGIIWLTYILNILFNILFNFYKEMVF